MQTLFNQFSQVLGTTLLHSLWQGLIVYALLRIVLMCMPSAAASSKYNLGLLALAASVIWPVVTFVIELGRQPIVSAVADLDAGPLAYIPMTHAYRDEVTHTLSFAFDSYMPYLVVLWFAGIALNSGRLLWGWRNIYLIKQSVTHITAFEDSVHHIQNMLGINKKIQVFLSEYVDVPCIVGYLKPMIIIPAGIITQFSAEQIKSILIHEMAHIRRNDYFINVIQQVVGIVFFFNPFTHLINKIIQHEREHCCDDLVLQITGEPMVYAQTLLKLEESRRRDIQLALAATGQKTYLLNRIKRMMETKKQTSNARHILVAVLLLIGSMSTIAWLNPEIKDHKVIITPVNPLRLINIFNDTTHVVKKVTKAKPVDAIKKARSKDRISQFDYNDPELDKLTAEVDKHSQAISKYYDSDDFKKMQEDLDKKSADIQAYFDKTEVKELQAKQDKLSEEFQSKWGNADEQEILAVKIYALEKECYKYLFTPEYKELDKRLKEKYDIKIINDPMYPMMHMVDRQSKNYAQYQKELDEGIPEASQKLRAQIKELQKQRKVYNKSPDAQARELRILADSMRKTFNNPQIKQTELEMKKLGEAMRAYQNNPQIKKEQQLLKASADKLKAYTNSPAFKKHIEQMKKTEVYQQNPTQKTQNSEKPGREEKPGPIENN